MLPPFDIYDRVVIVSEAFACGGVSPGTIGYIVDVYDDGCFEVEVSDRGGATVAMIVAAAGDLMAAPESLESS